MRPGLPFDCRSFRFVITRVAVGAAAILGACSSAPPDSTSAASRQRTTGFASTKPQRWVGRWHGAGAAALQIMPGNAARHYRLTLRSADGITTRYRATAADDRLIFNRAGRTLAIRTGRGDETATPALANLAHCLIVVPGHQGYCRHTGTADALPLGRGAYVAVKAGCQTARPTDVLYFNGKALARAGQTACHASVAGQDGVVFDLSDSCAAASADSNGGANETVTVPDPQHLSLQAAGQSARLYRYCATGLLPPNLRSQARRLR